MLIPTIDLGRCSACLGCIEVCPAVFRRNPAGGYVEVNDLEQYPADLVDEAIKLCPEGCIAWEETAGNQ
ncbi:MAG: ferredoxin [Deltaproteobacteria bacterium CG_4_10_14_3_um_filter_60_8]|nr:MAG: ferredoxin [Desulfobacterales bacterium CG2_30_60_27]PIY22961.1 MAG: ferredoxin [Deltaproteobacteria bacterium CG_4_10_14_3_um_filter_60_8]